MLGKCSTYKKGSKQSFKSHCSWLFTLFWKHWLLIQSHHRKTSQCWLKAIWNDTAIILHHVKVSFIIDFLWLIWLQDVRAMSAWLCPRKRREKQGSQRNPVIETAGHGTEGLSQGFCFSRPIQSILLPLWNSSLSFDEFLFLHESDLHMALTCHSPPPPSRREVLVPWFCVCLHRFMHFPTRNYPYFHQIHQGGNETKKE